MQKQKKTAVLQFKREAKNYVLANSAWFLNFGDRNGAGAKDLPKMKPFVPKKVIKIEPANLNDKTVPSGKKKKKKNKKI